ncbi:MAG: prolyl aminopeptidase [Neisseria sp.]|nr:prolyl aminopeptidase [Neisseria sp.]
MHPIVEPLNEGFLQVSDLHTIYWQESGSADGIPVILLHGGPGAGTTPKFRGFFNPKHYRLIMLDQRGCGRSTPFAEVRENSTWDLIADIERLREHLGIAKWLVFGGSWGSTLALAYAQTHAERVTGLILRGIFLGRQSEINWLNEAGGVSNIYPEQWQNYLAPIAPERHGDLVNAYHDILFGEDEAKARQAACAWTNWEGYLVRFEPVPTEEEADYAWAVARLENHYFVNRCWLDNERALLNNMDKIRHIKTIVVQGRYDLCTPTRSAWDLKQAFPELDLRIVQGGHTSLEGEIAQGLLRACDEFIEYLKD